MHINEPFKILFWNVKAEKSTENNRKKIRFLQEIVVKEQPDVICLCEHRFITQRVVDVFKDQYRLKEADDFLIMIPFGLSPFVPILKYNNRLVWITYISKHFKGLKHKNLYFCHLPNMHHFTDHERFSFAQHIGEYLSNLRQIQDIEYVILGDFNMFPYENGMQDTLAFNSYGTLEHEKYFTSTFQGIERTKYYNPFWSLYGNEERIYDPTRKITRLTPKKEQPRCGGTFKGKDTRKQSVLDQALIPIYALDQYHGCKVFHEGFNFSDHAPIMLEMNW